MDSGMQASSWHPAPQPHLVQDSASAAGDALFPSGVANSNGGMVLDPTQLTPFDYTNVLLDYHPSQIDAHTPFTFITTPPAHPASDYARERVVGQNHLPRAPFPPGSDHVQAPRVFSSPDEARYGAIARLPSVQYWFNLSSLPPNSDASPLLWWFLNMARLQEMYVREIWRYTTSRSEDEFVASIGEAERLDPRRPPRWPSLLAKHPFVPLRLVHPKPNQYNR
ncbi:hypothetical protein MSAN_01730300 [Mycena sanguinolenta]|uniref:Uncharacterized protein n=1 Tax=Mycena sanguinolenta TaxID=230812 RepID=A0A8H7CT49_9AGAR|nr:hypothetical protein MSAN_01730300 [Mycena sanguinolenta]